MKKHMIGITAYSIIVVYTGALVRHVNASLVCRDWPFCLNTSLSLPANFYEWVQMGHRAAAGFIFLWIGYVTLLAVKNYKHQMVVYWGWIISFILVSLQVTCGALIVLTRLNLYIALAHAFFISCLFGVLSYFILLTSRSKKNEMELKKCRQKNRRIRFLSPRFRSKLNKTCSRYNRETGLFFCPSFLFILK